MDRTILHVDLNNFYPSVECLHRLEMRGQPVAVGEDVEQPHRIILAKNYIAKRYDVKTDDVIWQAKQKCPNLIVLPPLSASLVIRPAKS
ncbi:impB/mucB/samB family protein [Hydrogenoanaerobacterium saccharovorans]|uniref:DNA polymerase-4 n=1 Tax=Hydrogenoanaerobacterium saccharovorans TaxID=474960 RepID=A0A1H8BP90_9FIRM|nr:impB/mucB/samB family protein [Hydrogenoanaerobacterium saccharovorans]SEM83717.1 DNA polymerase-4 [Hydrogenoanaerobacterium saccharovorans]